MGILRRNWIRWDHRHAVIPLGPRVQGYDVLANTYIDRQGAKNLSDATEDCWQALLQHDLPAFGQSVRRSFEAQIAMFPHMMNDMVAELLGQYHSQALGWKLSGAGGGGYLIFVTETPIPDSMRVCIRRKE